MAHSSHPTETVELSRASEEGALVLTVVGEDHVSTHPLPPSGKVVIGRADECAVRIEAPSVSRQHAELELGATLTVRDLGSSNGTRVGKRRVARGEAVPFEPGEPIEVGQVLVLVRRGRPSSRPRRLMTHGSFEMLLERACEAGRPFALVRLRVDRAAPRGRVASALSAELGSDESLASYGAGDFEVLLPGADERVAERRSDELLARAEEIDPSARAGIALFPRDGRDPDRLVFAASSALYGVTAGGPVVADPAMQRVFALVDRIARGNISVLVVGETGTGKELIAEAIHQRSPRRDRPLVRVNCAALTESLLESELFGHEKGAFTGATEAKAGLLEAAEGGTVFLDEVGELSLSTQAKLLRVIEEQAVRRVGSVKVRPIDVRFVAATNRNLETEVAAGRFRQDLFYRLGVTIVVPPLRERPADIEPLAASFAERSAAALGRAPVRLSAAALNELRRYAWPGNIRELRNLVERAVLLCEGDELGLEHLPLEKMRAPVVTQVPPPFEPAPLVSDEKERILEALARCGGNQSRAAKLLGISRRTLLYRLDAYGLPRPIKR